MHYPCADPNKKIVYVVVLGDFGRSPRMQFHSASLSKSGFFVHVIAYAGERDERDMFFDFN